MHHSAQGKRIISERGNQLILEPGNQLVLERVFGMGFLLSCFPSRFPGFLVSFPRFSRFPGFLGFLVSLVSWSLEVISWFYSFLVICFPGFPVSWFRGVCLFAGFLVSQFFVDLLLYNFLVIQFPGFLVSWFPEVLVSGRRSFLVSDFAVSVLALFVPQTVCPD